MFLQKRTIFLLECLYTVMLVLIGDIPFYHFQVRGVDGKEKNAT